VAFLEVKWVKQVFKYTLHFLNCSDITGPPSVEFVNNYPCCLSTLDFSPSEPMVLCIVCVLRTHLQVEKKQNNQVTPPSPYCWAFSNADKREEESHRKQEKRADLQKSLTFQVRWAYNVKHTFCTTSNFLLPNTVFPTTLMLFLELRTKFTQTHFHGIPQCIFSLSIAFLWPLQSYGSNLLLDWNTNFHQSVSNCIWLCKFYQ
jgi:hypothetical protein